MPPVQPGQTFVRSDVKGILRPARIENAAVQIILDDVDRLAPGIAGIEEEPLGHPLLRNYGCAVVPGLSVRRERGENATKTVRGKKACRGTGHKLGQRRRACKIAVLRVRRV